MTYLEAAYQILLAAKEPLHYADVAQRALDRGLIMPTGRTPTATMGSRLYTDTLKEETRFGRVGRGVFELAQPQASGIDGQVRVLNGATRQRLRDLLGAIPPERFEALITELLIQMGFDESTVQVTSYGSDGGIDVTGIYRATGLTEVNAAVQVKRWKRNIQAPVVTQLRGSLQVHQQGIIITTSGFSKGAQAEATALNKTRIGLINGAELLELLIKHRVGVTEKTLRVIGLDDEWWGELLGEEAEPARPEAVEVAPVGAVGPTDASRPR
ncbi:MAG: restriction endonuclease [Caldilineaceae bacterium]|nr:restriction endonuclease [Caldilineaceae bacterium]